MMASLCFYSDLLDTCIWVYFLKPLYMAIRYVGRVLEIIGGPTGTASKKWSDRGQLYSKYRDVVQSKAYDIPQGLRSKQSLLRRNTLRSCAPGNARIHAMMLLNSVASEAASAVSVICLQPGFVLRMATLVAVYLCPFMC